MPPERSAQQRADALQRALVVRRERSALRAELKTGRADAVAAVDNAAIAGARVRWFLESLPGVGSARAEGIMLELAIAPSRRLGGLSDRQRAGLIARIDGRVR